MSRTIDPTRSRREARYIIMNAPAQCQRSGQFLFNSLRHEVAEAVRGTLFDPFYKDLSEYEVADWLENHVIYNDQGEMICVFSGNTILWEEG
jgi:hypothetical protein